ncbi:hypothetical protein MHBO_002818 [Bonamia ostreae]|uniref:Uncharacterized protein n=1 Tax=Bonamia ostreae TaxID=126728 RepID=A0ABV2AP21_9EUKA
MVLGGINNVVFKRFFEDDFSFQNKKMRKTEEEKYFDESDSEESDSGTANESENEKNEKFVERPKIEKMEKKEIDLCRFAKKEFNNEKKDFSKEKFSFRLKSDNQKNAF